MPLAESIETMVKETAAKLNLLEYNLFVNSSRESDVLWLMRSLIERTCSENKKKRQALNAIKALSYYRDRLCLKKGIRIHREKERNGELHQSDLVVNAKHYSKIKLRQCLEILKEYQQQKTKELK